MDKINPEDWKAFSTIVRTHWPTISEEDLMGTEGFRELVEQLVESHTIEPVDHLKSEVKAIFKNISEHKHQ